MKSRLQIFALLAAALPVLGQPRPPELAPTPGGKPAEEAVKPNVKKIDETKYQIGEVTFDEKSREIRFPAKVNLTEGNLEYLIVKAPMGKLHESLLSTEISATDLNVAFKLLRYPASRELYALPNQTGGISGNFPDVPADVKAGARIAIDVEWQQEGKTKRVPINDWVQQEIKGQAMPAGPWVYGGSDFNDGKFIPEVTGDIAAIFVSGYSLIVYPGKDNSDDEVWIPYPKRVPAEATAVTVIISPQKKP